MNGTGHTGFLGRGAAVAILVSLCALPSMLGQNASQAGMPAVPFRENLLQQAGFPGPSGNSDRFVSLSGSDANDGTRQHPWRTINHAGSMASPGMSIHVAPGIYGEAVVTMVSGTAPARIRYVSDQGWGAVILAPGRDGFAWRNTGNFTDILGFEISGGRCGGIGLGGSFQRAIANHVHNSAAGCSSSDGGSGINDFDYSTEGNEIIGNYVHDVGSGEPLCGQPQHNYVQGIYQANAGGRIEHNVVSNNCGFGIHLWHGATRASIVNNTVAGNRAGGILVGSGDAPCSTTGCPGGNDYTTVRNNVVAFNGNSISGGWGISERSQEPGRTGVHNEYSHNLSFQNVSGDFSMPPALPCKSCITGTDPRFVSAATGDYRLRKDSPAIGDRRWNDPHGQRGDPSTTLARASAIGALPEAR